MIRVPIRLPSRVFGRGTRRYGSAVSSLHGRWYRRFPYDNRCRTRSPRTVSHGRAPAANFRRGDFQVRHCRHVECDRLNIRVCQVRDGQKSPSLVSSPGDERPYRFFRGLRHGRPNNLHPRRRIFHVRIQRLEMTAEPEVRSLPLGGVESIEMRRRRFHSFGGIACTLLRQHRSFRSEYDKTNRSEATGSSSLYSRDGGTLHIQFHGWYARNAGMGIGTEIHRFGRRKGKRPKQARRPRNRCHIPYLYLYESFDV